MNSWTSYWPNLVPGAIDTAADYVERFAELDLA